MSFLVSLLLPIIATVIYFHRYPERAAAGQVPARLTTVVAVTKGAATGAAALLFLGVVGVIILAYRRKVITPPEVEVPALIFWGIQFLIAAAIGAVVGVLTTLVLLPTVRARLAQIVPDGSVE